MGTRKTPAIPAIPDILDRLRRESLRNLAGHTAEIVARVFDQLTAAVGRLDQHATS